VAAHEAPSLPILPARAEHASAFAAYIVEHVAESGRDGSPHFALVTSDTSDEIRSKALDRWSRSIQEPLWGRAWLLWTATPPPPGPSGYHAPPAHVLGHVELRGGPIQPELHRAVLAVGILRPHTGQGHGRRLLEAAIAWARDETGLAYIDLGVFAGNERAKRLYERMGFMEQGFRPDAFRLDEEKIDNVWMTLAL
jgi:RimJ/RimL family protein N-acetyltransferase